MLPGRGGGWVVLCSGLVAVITVGYHFHFLSAGATQAVNTIVCNHGDPGNYASIVKPCSGSSECFHY